MQKKDLTDQVLKKLHQLGADLAGVVSFETMQSYGDQWSKVREVLGEAKSVVVFGVPLKKNLCNDCDLCIQACPVGAIDDDGNVDVIKCAKENMKLGLPGITQFVKAWVGASDDEKRTMLKSPTFWEIWQTLTAGIFYYCFECLNACPAGRREKGR